MANWTEDELRAWESTRNVHVAALAGTPVHAPKKRQEKYRNQRCEVGGIKLQSLKEAEAYVRLKALSDAGIIQRLELQPRFLLVEAFEHAGVKYRASHYVGDFSFWQDGVRHVIDTKSPATETPLFKLKWKLAIRSNPETHFEVW